MVMNDAILIIPRSDKPGHIHVMHGGRRLEMSVGDAEAYKDRFERKKIIPNLKKMACSLRCRRATCKAVTDLRCRACRASYCSRYCQRLDWHRHVFICTVRTRPNLADSLVLQIRDALESQVKDLSLWKLRKQLLADEDLSTAFGFLNCETLTDVNNLICLYRHLSLKRRAGAMLQEWVDSGRMKEKITHNILSKKIARHDCHQWFLSTGKLFQEEPVSGMAAYVKYGYVHALNLLCEPDSDDQKPSDTERRIFWLYSMLLRDIDNVPDESNPEWINFGFCFCPNHEWKMKVAHAYIELAKRAALSEIARHWEVHSQLNDLFKRKNIDISDFERAGISFGRPNKDRLGVYRLMVEVKHFQRGVFCACARSYTPCCKRFPESWLSAESVVEYGFDKLNPWERWQMVLLYQELFKSTKFDAREMYAARRSPDHRALQKYIERMVDVRQYQNMYKAGALFPDLRGRLIWETSVTVLCYCICH